MMTTLLSKIWKPVVALAALGATFGLGRISAPSASVFEGSEPQGPEVVTYFGRALTAGELSLRMQALGPAARARLSTADKRREFVLHQARLESMAEEARQKGYDRDPELQRRFTQELVALYTRREFEEPLSKKTPTDAEVEVEAYFEAHRAEWARPERLRVGRIFVAAPETDPARRREGARKAEQLLSKTRTAVARDLYAFSALAREHSEDEDSRLLGGDLRLLTRDELGEKLGPEAVVALEGARPGQVLDIVVARPEGFEILQLIHREPAVEPRLEELRETLNQRLMAERRAKAHGQFLEALDQRANIRIDDAALATLE